MIACLVALALTLGLGIAAWLGIAVVAALLICGSIAWSTPTTCPASTPPFSP